eukprot:TRINITY_DN2906_c0_g1_i1.p1 TRINITY_DN2906_c0_g1~~TRINITY_DN2906_c0_g1_i1.p1  ORF type:complete len:536 (+),score=203.69 TRINITY_DN2906_c0_g1_i1:118-1608(+)
MEEKTPACNLPLRKRIHSFNNVNTNTSNESTNAPSPSLPSLPSLSPSLPKNEEKNDKNEEKNASYLSPKPTKVIVSSLEYSPPIDIETVSDDEEKTSNILDKMIHDLSPPSVFPHSLPSKPKSGINNTVKHVKSEENITKENFVKENIPLPRKQQIVQLQRQNNDAAASKKRVAEKNSMKKKKAKKQRHEDEESSSSEEEETYCFCRKPDHGKFMIACDHCDEWFHGECVNITKEQASKIRNYVCSKCQNEAAKAEEKAKQNAKPLKKCFHVACANAAKNPSKYCCDSCGMAAGRENLKKQKMQELGAKASAFSAADIDDFKKLEEMQAKKKTMEAGINAVFEQGRELEKAISHAASLFSSSVDDTGKKQEDGGNSEVIDCVTCGRPIQAKNYPRHIESCYQKAAGVRITTKNGRQLLCGCPTTESTNGVCDRPKKNCEKHVNWENLKRAQLEQEKLRQQQSFNALLEEERIIQDRIRRRHLALENNSVHLTIVET